MTLDAEAGEGRVRMAGFDPTHLGRQATERFSRARQIFGFVRGAALSWVILTLAVGSALFADVITPHDPSAGQLADALTAPFWEPGGVAHHVLGTDHLGRDSLARLVHGGRISLLVGTLAVFISGLLGTALALVAGYFGGWLDTIIMRLVDAALAIPNLMLAIALVAVIGQTITGVILVIGLLYWPVYARVLRGEVLKLKENDYVRLAVVAGCGRWTIMWRHLFPNLVSSVIVLATLQLGRAIVAESSLSFLGLGVPRSVPSWGSMLAEAQLQIYTSWWLAVFPGLALTLVVLSSNIIGDWLRVRLDPRLRR